MLLAPLLLGLTLGSSLPTVPPVTLTAAWTSVQLPAAPMRIAEHDGTLWVSGADEMIADSRDGGRHWTVRNYRRGGELLYNFVFPEPNHILVFGSAGVRYESQDGGEKWKRKTYRPVFDLAQMAFVDAKHGFAIGTFDFASTDDGGETWNAMKAKDGPRRPDPGFPRYIQDYRRLIEVAASDAKHGYILTGAGQDKVQHLLFTADGGRHWKQAALTPSENWTRLRAEAGKFHLFGTTSPSTTSKTTAGDSPRSEVEASGTGAALSLKPVPDDAYCTAPGCLLGAGSVWKDMRGPTPKYWRVPNDDAQPLSISWTAQDATFCRVSTELRCRTGEEPATPPKLEPSLIVSPDVVALRCVKCGPPNYPDVDRQRHVMGAVILRVLIAKDGNMAQVLTESAPSATLGEEAARAVRLWKYIPSPMMTETTITVNFELGEPL